MLYKNSQKPRTTTVSVRIRLDVIAHLKHVARQQAASEHRDISHADLIRDAISRLYPLPEHDLLSPEVPQQ